LSFKTTTTNKQKKKKKKKKKTIAFFPPPVFCPFGTATSLVAELQDALTQFEAILAEIVDDASSLDAQQVTFLVRTGRCVLRMSRERRWTDRQTNAISSNECLGGAR
jgi:hypothetical protein